ncbi:hypothetical protein C8R44DRAFT_740297 [Mycena epipterygia]|nr:hypothetical protein C8R44DRAFT_740297 [Mycena epipterygia]
MCSECEELWRAQRIGEYGVCRRERGDSRGPTLQIRVSSDSNSSRFVQEICASVSAAQRNGRQKRNDQIYQLRAGEGMKTDEHMLADANCSRFAKVWCSRGRWWRRGEHWIHWEQGLWTGVFNLLMDQKDLGGGPVYRRCLLLWHIVQQSNEPLSFCLTQVFFLMYESGGTILLLCVGVVHQAPGYTGVVHPKVHINSRSTSRSTTKEHVWSIGPRTTGLLDLVPSGSDSLAERWKASDIVTSNTRNTWIPATSREIKVNSKKFVSGPLCPYLGWMLEDM